MNVIDRVLGWLKRRYLSTELADAMLLAQYGAKSIDELYVMILMDRTAEPIPLVNMPFKAAAGRAVIKLMKLRAKAQKLNRKKELQAKEAVAKNAHKLTARRNLESKRLARDREQYKKYLQNIA